MRRFIITLVVFLTAFITFDKDAQAEPTITSGIHDDRANPALRGFSEIAFGTLFGAIAAGTPLITTLVVTQDVELALGLTAALYPAGIASGVILGGYLTDSYSNYWAPFVGAYAGAIIADITAYFLNRSHPILSSILVITLPIITSVIATEVSHTRNRHDAYYPVMISFPF